MSVTGENAMSRLTKDIQLLDKIHAQPGIAWLGFLFTFIPLACRSFLEPWIFMWMLTAAIWAGCKWLAAWQDLAVNGAPDLRGAIAYFCLWPGMDAEPFFQPRFSRNLPRVNAWLGAFLKTFGGGLLIWLLVRRVENDLVAGWIGMIGLILVLHFGLFHLLALAWQTAGVPVQNVMQAPVLASSLAHFWCRWNTPFHQIVNQHIFRPAARRWGAGAATLLVFLASGLVHDLVISVPARAGYGWPTAYFLLQGMGVLFQRSKPARRWNLHRGFGGWLGTAVVAAGPAFWLFHPPFVRNVMIPFFNAIGAL
jgi:hypothetical protein